MIADCIEHIVYSTDTTGGTQFGLESYAWGTCAIAYDNGFVMIGGYETGLFIRQHHGKVDR